MRGAKFALSAEVVMPTRNFCPTDCGHNCCGCCHHKKDHIHHSRRGGRQRHGDLEEPGEGCQPAGIKPGDMFAQHERHECLIIFEALKLET